jgi:hypothetical protein
MFGGRCFNGAQLTVFAKIETPKIYLTGKGWRREARNNADGRTRTGTGLLRSIDRLSVTYNVPARRDRVVSFR